MRLPRQKLNRLWYLIKHVFTIVVLNGSKFDWMKMHVSIDRNPQAGLAGSRLTSLQPPFVSLLLWAPDPIYHFPPKSMTFHLTLRRFPLRISIFVTYVCSTGYFFHYIYYVNLVGVRLYRFLKITLTCSSLVCLSRYSIKWLVWIITFSQVSDSNKILTIL